MKEGKIIAAFGIPGSGKSTTTKEIGKILDINTYNEPEEEEWGETIAMRQIIGNFSALMWFRSVRLPNLFKAEQHKKNKEVSMLDSCYDSMFYLYHNTQGLEWLFDPHDLYGEEMISISKKDFNHLPKIDIVVFFKQNETTWRMFLKNRNRELDNDIEFQKSFVLQKGLLDAAIEYCETKNSTLIIHEQQFSSPKEEAVKVCNLLRPHLQ